MAKTKRTPYTSKRWTTWFNKKCDALHRTGFQEFLENEKKIDLINKVKETIFDSAYLEFIRVKKPLHHSGTTIIVKRLKKVTTPDERLDSLWQRIYDAAEINDSTLRIRFRNYLEDEGFEEYDLRNMLLNKRTLSSHLAGFYQSEGYVSFILKKGTLAIRGGFFYLKKPAGLRASTICHSDENLKISKDIL